ncbi:GrpB family protein [Corallococcus macrosporus]|uniref:GrpB family protein n=1 Tax=Corallococcus macrosporus TaxID=35 RepID=A0ABS3DCJ6_9BACT|nr:GrpB family protein [Corallococcus macrosporus]MBN8229371.1 GrpB family protein [Corallococcus macrosporus]
MPPPIKVCLVPHEPRWADAAVAHGQALKGALGANVREVHHIGSTAVPGIHAKPILDLIPVVASLEALDARRGELEAMGYEWWGELGLPGRRYCTLHDPVTRERVVQLHCFVEGSPEITRHLAFRDYLRTHPTVAREYNDEKARCQRLHPDDSHAYGNCKASWIKRVEAEALAALGAP